MSLLLIRINPVCVWCVREWQSYQAPEERCSNCWKIPLCAFNDILCILVCRYEHCDSQERGTAKGVTCIIIELSTRGGFLWLGRLLFDSFCFSPRSLAVLLDPIGIFLGLSMFESMCFRVGVVRQSDGEKVDTFSGTWIKPSNLVKADYNWHPQTVVGEGGSIVFVVFIHRHAHILRSFVLVDLSLSLHPHLNLPNKPQWEACC